MKACDEKLKNSLMEAMELDVARLKEQTANTEPHTFSPEFERNMEKLIKQVERKSKMRAAFRYVAAVLVVTLLTGGIIFIGSGSLRASEMSISIREWFESFFTVEDGTRGRKESDALFDKSRIRYMPEGFELVEEYSSFILAQYKFINSSDEYIILRISKDRAVLDVDNVDIEQEIRLNDAGYEYTRTHKDNSSEEVLMWRDDNEIYYFLAGTVDVSALVNIMDNISY